jgi:Ni,Fe-hydrogenase III large subunit
MEQYTKEERTERIETIINELERLHQKMSALIGEGSPLLQRTIADACRTMWLVRQEMRYASEFNKNDM